MPRRPKAEDGAEHITVSFSRGVGVNGPIVGVNGPIVLARL
jgi:hypothetical protein